MEPRKRNVALWIIIGIVLVVLCCVALAVAALVGYFTTASVERGWSGPTQEERVEQRFDVGEAQHLVVDNFAGDVIIRVGDAGSLEVIATKRARGQGDLQRIQVTMEPTAEGVRVATDRTPMGLSNTSVELEIRVPPGTSIRVDTGAGQVQVQDVGGDVNVHTGAGDVRLDGVAGDIEADTGAGSIDVNGGTGRVRLHTGAGSVNFEGDPQGDYDLDTGAGSIRIVLPAGANAELDLTTGIGDIRVDFDVAGRVTRRDVQGTIGTGTGATIRAHTGTGGIDLVRQ